MDTRARWELLATFATGFEADLARARLEAEDIPVLTKGQQVGIVGAAFQGVVAGGIELLVPSPELDRAREVLAD